MRRIISLLLIAATLVCFVSCSGPVSSYKAMLLITSNGKSDCSLRADSFEGRYVFKLKASSGKNSEITYNASLGEGTVNISCDADGTVSPLFSLQSGESVSNTGIPLEAGKNGRVYIIIETHGKVTDLAVNIDVK